MYNIYCFSVAAKVMQMHLIVTLYVHCLSCKDLADCIWSAVSGIYYQTLLVCAEVQNNYISILNTSDTHAY